MDRIVDPDVERYAEEHTTPPPEHLVALAEETRSTLSTPQMMTGPVEGRFLELLVFATGARRVLEIGTYSGYSALSMAAGLGPEGGIVTCEIDPQVAEVARCHFAASPYADRIEQRVGPALETVEELDGPFDLVFIDADKEGYARYVDAVLPKLAPRGLIAIDNTLWSGRVVGDRGEADQTTRALMELNERLREDPGLVCALLTVRDGVTLVRRADAGGAGPGR